MSVSGCWEQHHSSLDLLTRTAASLPITGNFQPQLTPGEAATINVFLNLWELTAEAGMCVCFSGAITATQPRARRVTSASSCSWSPAPCLLGVGTLRTPGRACGGAFGARPSPRSCPLAQEVAVQVFPCRWESGAGRAAGPIPHWEGKEVLPLHPPQHPGTTWMSPTAGTPVGTHLGVRPGSAAGPHASKAMLLWLRSSMRRVGSCAS